MTEPAAGRDDESGSDRPADEILWPPLPVITSCVLGCLIPAYAYAEAMAAIRGFGAVSRRWAGVLLLVPTVAWIWHFGLFAALLLAPQFLIAWLVSLVIARVRARGQRSRGDPSEVTPQ